METKELLTNVESKIKEMRAYNQNYQEFDITDFDFGNGYTYVDSAFNEAADGYCSIYTSDCLSWLRDNLDLVDDALSSNDCDSVVQAVQMAQYEYYYNEITSSTDDIYLYYALGYLLSLNITEIATDTLDIIESDLAGAYVERWEDIRDIVDNALAPEEEEEEEEDK